MLEDDGDLAEKVAIVHCHLSEAERATGGSAETLTALARALDVPERWIS